MTRTPCALLLLLSACGGAVGDWEPVDTLGGLVLFDTDFDGQAARCLLDTGADLTVLRSDLPQTAVQALIGDRDVLVDPLDLGELGDAVLDGIGDPLGGIDCLMGWDSFAGQALTVDYVHHRIRVARSVRRAARIDDDAGWGEPVVLDLDPTSPLPTAAARLQGLPVHAVFDTGAQVALVPPAVVDALDPVPDLQPLLIVTPDGTIEGGLGFLQDVTLGGSTHDDVAFAAYDSVQLQALIDGGVDVDAVIGASSLVRYAVTFDDGDRTLTLQPYRGADLDASLGEYTAFVEAGGLRAATPRATIASPW
ncbi:MAG: aspartyl protease family protein [Myxococcota bacterium]